MGCPEPPRTLAPTRVTANLPLTWHLSADGADGSEAMGWDVWVRNTMTADPPALLTVQWQPETDAFQGSTKVENTTLGTTVTHMFIPGAIASLAFSAVAASATDVVVAGSARRVPLWQAPQDARWLWGIKDLGTLAAAGETATAAVPVGAVGYRVSVAEAAAALSATVEELLATVVVAGYLLDPTTSTPGQLAREWKPLLPLVSVNSAPRQIRVTNKSAAATLEVQIEWLFDLWGSGVLR